MAILENNFTFIDLFAGIGGFRHAMNNYSNGNARCLYSSEINSSAAKIYNDNFHQEPLGDIRTIDPIELHLESPDVICGGFPCQTFSKGGNQAGFKDSRGTLFREIIRIINCYPNEQKPKVLILENVQNLVNHDDGETWKTIHHEIQEAGYNVISKPIVAAPKDFNVPQLRNRAIILAVRRDIYDGDIDIHFVRRKQNTCNLITVLDQNLSPEDQQKYALTPAEINVLDCWQDFLNQVPEEERIIGFPIWSDEFGKHYSVKNLPKWKQDIINKNRNFYAKHQETFSQWMRRWNIRATFTPTNRKFEWQAGKSMNSIYDGIIQFRTSGIRVKRPTESPALVAMDHRPIYGPFRRFITTKEAARLQSFPEDFIFDEPDKETFKQLGNAVNVTVIESVFRMFIQFLDNQED